MREEMKWFRFYMADEEAMKKVMLQSDVAFCVYFQITMYAAQLQKVVLADELSGGRVIPMGPAMLAECLPLKHRTAQEIESALAVLEAYGLIEIIAPPETDFRDVIHIMAMDEQLDEFLAGVERRRVDNERKKVEREKAKALPAPKEKKEKKPTKIESEFEEVWAEYPRKQGKTQARKAYIKARKDGVTKEDILDGISRYKQYINARGVDQEYIKMGSTWFNQRCWDDEYNTAPAGNPKQNTGWQDPRDRGARPEREATPAQAAWGEYILEMDRMKPDVDALPDATRKALSAISGPITWPAFEAAYEGVTA